MTSKTKTQVAQAASQIREILKKTFSNTKFQVKSKSYSMGDSINVNWIDGVAKRKVEELICHYKYGSFNGMEDIYEITNGRNDIPQTKYLFINRKISDEVYLAKLDELRTKWDVLANIQLENINKMDREIFDKTGHWTAKDFICSRFGGFKEINI